MVWRPGPRCIRETRSRSLLTPGIGEERELAHDERLAGCVEKRSVEPPVVGGEDPEPGDLAGEALRLRRRSHLRRPRGARATPPRSRQPTVPRRSHPALLTRWTTARTTTVFHSRQAGRISLNQGNPAADTLEMEAVRTLVGPPSGRSSCATAQSPRSSSSTLSPSNATDRTSGLARSWSRRVCHTSCGLARPRRAARARVRRARPAVDRARSRHAAAREPGPPLPRPADSLPRGRLRARRSRRPDERHVLRRAPARARDAGSRLRCLAGIDRARDHDLNDTASAPIEEFVSDALESEDTATPRPPPRHAGRRLHQQSHFEGARSRCLRHPLHTAGAPRVRARARRRRHARADLDCGHPGNRRREPPQDHGRARHRRATRSAGRPGIHQAGRGIDRRPHRDPADDVRRKGHDAHPLAGRSTGFARRPWHVAAESSSARARDLAAVRCGRRRRADGIRQDNDALHLPPDSQHTRPPVDDDRGSRRISGRRASIRSRSTRGPGSPSHPASGRCSGRIRMCCSSERSETRKPHRSPFAPR